MPKKELAYGIVPCRLAKIVKRPGEKTSVLVYHTPRPHLYAMLRSDRAFVRQWVAEQARKSASRGV